MKRRQIFIELTSLLDVILIMIFVLLTQARTQTAKAIEEAAGESAAAREIRAELRGEKAAKESLAAEVDQLKEQNEALARQLTSKGVVMENSLVLTLSIREDNAVLLERDGAETHSISYTWEEGNYTYNRLRSLLSEQLDSAGEKSVFLVFQYDSEKIYHAEYALIMQAVQEIRLDAKRQEIPLNFVELDILD